MTSFAERAARGVARCTPDDFDDLRRFQAEEYGDRAGLVPTAWLEWLQRNPQRAADGVPVWICRRDGRVVGQQAEIAARLRVGPAEVAAAYPIELMVNERWRLRGVGPALAAAQRDASRVSCAIWMTDEMHRLYERAGWIDLGSVPRFVAVARASAVARSLESPARRAGAAAAVPFVAAGSLAAVSVGRARAPSTRLVEVARFDDRADAVWTRACVDYGVLARRDAASLRWRFDESPFAGRYRRFYLLHGEDAVGYAVLRATRWRQAASLRVVDYLAPRRFVSPLLTSCLVLARRDRSTAFVDLLTRNDRSRRELLALGFLPAERLPWFRDHAVAMRLMVAVGEDDPLRGALGDAGSWFVTGGEADVDLVEMQLEAMGDLG
ncbi:MAG TPA: hypothetical protein VEP49_13715 [Acidimicrobiia bacterium]|nr:hypothetical protein [Acidimicrobiia bacterium]